MTEQETWNKIIDTLYGIDFACKATSRHGGCSHCKYSTLENCEFRLQADALIEAGIGDVSELKAENAALREKLEDVKVFALKMKSGEIDMTIGSDVFNFITSILVQMLAQNNAENFLTTAIEVDAQEYSITVQRHAGKTPAEEISELKAENAKLRERLSNVEECLKELEKEE